MPGRRSRRWMSDTNGEPARRDRCRDDGMVSPPADCTGKVEASPFPVPFAPRAVRPPGAGLGNPGRFEPRARLSRPGA